MQSQYTPINQNKSKYSFGRKAFSNKISKDKIMLPIKNGKPDYDYMEEYIKNLLYKKINQYLNYLVDYILNISLNHYMHN